MSFYLGQSTLGGKVMHIAKNSHSKEEMQGGIIADTVFHSDLEYITYDLYTGPLNSYTNYGITSTFMEVPLDCIDLITTQQRLYFWIYKEAGQAWKMHIAGTSGVMNSIIWFPTNTGGNYSNYPSTTARYLNKAGNIESFYIVVVNINSSGYIPIPKTTTDVIVRHGDIIVNGIDLYDLRYINSSTVNSEDIVFTSNSGTMQLINSTYSAPGNMSILSNPSYTKIFNGSRALWDTNIARDKIYFSAKYFTNIPYGAVVTSSSTTRDFTILPNGSMSEGDMFFIQDTSSGAAFIAGNNKLLRYVNGLIAQVNYESFYFNGLNTAIAYYYGDANGRLFYRSVVTIVGSGVKVTSKERNITTYKLK